MLRKAGLRRAFVSSSSDRGTQMLYRLAPDLIVPVLRPYRRRGELGTWFKYTSVGDKLAELLARNTYAGIGEFHIFGKDADLAVPRRMVRLAARYKIFLHAHADAEALDRIFAQDPEARVLWTHSAFDNPEGVAAMLSKHKNLWSDLAFRSEHATGSKVDPHCASCFWLFPTASCLAPTTLRRSGGTMSLIRPTGPANGWLICPWMWPKTSPTATPKHWRAGHWVRAGGEPGGAALCGDHLYGDGIPIKAAVCSIRHRK